ncbi:MAG: acyl-CoA dehydrogenase family protein, partial [Actinomycetota bacterium]|nr:acyl-CoA dehydrogenase family protein [Actinomycetota bacterium]
MSHYKSNLRDIVFNLFEVNDVASLLGQPPFEDFDTATVHQVLVELERLATEDMAASFVEADRHAPHLVNGSVTLPAGLKRSLDAYYDGGWDMLAVPTELGGLGAPSQVRWAGQEMLIGANPTAFF